MRLSLAQMSMVNDMDRNFKKGLQFLDLADTHKADLVVFPKLMLSPYFPQYRRREVGGELNHIPSEFAIELTDEKIATMAGRAAEYGFYVSPNFYIEDEKGYTCRSLWIDSSGNVNTDPTQMCVFDGRGFYEEDYFDGRTGELCVYDTPFGKVGVVVGSDRHFPEAIRACADKGADLVVIPASNISIEPLDIYEYELRSAAYDNCCFVAMANRVGAEGNCSFAGHSMVVAPDGNIVVKADDSQQFIICNIEPQEARIARENRPFLSMHRKVWPAFGVVS